MKIETLANRVRREIDAFNRNGYTLDLETFELVTKGYPVGYKETQDSWEFVGLCDCIKHALQHDKVIGMWKNPANHRQYDSVKIFYDLNEALEFARANGQEAIWDLYEMREIKC
jgi:hypothetical protein